MQKQTLEISGLRPAHPADAPAITAVINLAFQKESSFKKGDRIDEQQVREKMSTGSFYVVENEGVISACIYIETASADSSGLASGPNAGYIGMLAVHPSLQGRGLGRKLMTFGEAELQRRDVTHIQLRIVNLRTELLDFYSRLGYRETGTAPYPFPEKTTRPIHFIHMEKSLP